MSKIRVGIAGYGNIGRGVETALSRAEDMEIVGVFTRRDPASVKTVTGVKVYRLDDAEDMRNDIDVM
ncbi:MAG: diaminopimelate dehydrogenase, partial [Ruminococcaceae bacterium]|nr:diaminopimelate dehydrogenase [Oscillospiraceae bacterium]